MHTAFTYDRVGNVEVLKVHGLSHMIPNLAHCLRPSESHGCCWLASWWPSDILVWKFGRRQQQRGRQVASKPRTPWMIVMGCCSLFLLMSMQNWYCWTTWGAQRWPKNLCTLCTNNKWTNKFFIFLFDVKFILCCHCYFFLNLATLTSPAYVFGCQLTVLNPTCIKQLTATDMAQQTIEIMTKNESIPIYQLSSPTVNWSVAVNC